MYSAVRRVLLELPCKSCPELLLLGLLSTPPTQWSTLREELYATLLPMFLRSGPSAPSTAKTVRQRVWAADREPISESSL